MISIPNEHVSAHVLEALKSWAASKPKISRLYVFGSRVTGINKHGGPVRQESDLDVAVILSDDVHNRTLFWMFDAKPWRRELAVLVPHKVHLELLEPDTPELADHVTRSGVLIFNRP